MESHKQSRRKGGGVVLNWDLANVERSKVMLSPEPEQIQSKTK